MMRRCALLFAALFCVVSFLPRTALSQAVYGNIFGTITDPSGAAVPNAKVTITDLAKGTVDTVTTNATGNYTATHLIPDNYSVKVEAAGFKAAEQKPIVVMADTGARVDLALQIGEVTQAVEVTGQAPQLKTDRADVAIEFNQRYVENLPLLNRNFTSLELASPGTQKLVGWSHAATENPQGSQQIFVNGQHFSGTGYELDGTDNQDPILGIIVVNPNIDAVQETKFALQNYDAEFGKAVAGVVTTQTKSGSNDLHGSGFWFRRTDATAARDPFTQYAPDPVTGRMIPSAKWNQFGGTIGGPILKDKLFFFGDYQGTRQTNGLSNQLTIPTARVLSTCLAGSGFCDLSQYQPFIGNGTAGDPTNYIYDPASSTAPDGSGRAAFCGATEVLNPTPATCPTPFLIPVGKLSPQALNILKLFPQPTNGNVQNNFVGAGSGPFKQNSFDTRIDYQASQSVHVFGRFSLDYFDLSGKGALGALGGIGFGPGGLNGTARTHNYSLASGFDKVISSTLLTDFRFGYFKYNPISLKGDQGTNPATGFGIPGMNLGDVTTSGLPGFFMDGMMSNFGDGLNITRCNCPLTESEQQFQFVNNWTKVKGNHQIKFGADMRYAMNLRIPSDSNRTGQLNFNHNVTANAGNGGLDLATFLLGDVSFMDRFVSSSLNAAERQKRFFYYGQDTWRVTPKLTVNYGLRWEIYWPETVNGKGQGGFANLTQGIIRVAGYGPYGTNGNISNDWHAFAPRLGAAYELNNKTVIRMGYGRSFDIGVFGSNFGHTVTQNLPVLVDQNVTATNCPTCTLSGTQDRIPVFTLAQGPPAFVFPTIPSDGALPLAGPRGDTQPKVRPPFQRLPTVDAWNLTLQRQLSNSMSAEIAYVGSKGTHIFAGTGPSYNANQPSEVGFAQGVPQAQRRPFYNHYSYPGFIDPTTGTTLMCCSIDLGYLGNDASNNYNSLQVRFNKRFSQGLQFQANYTWSKSLNYDSNYYIDNPTVAYGPDDMNRKHVFIFNAVYTLPFGRGKAYAANAGRALDAVIGGWELSTTTNWSSGLPWTPSTSVCGNEEDVGVCRPDRGSGSFPTGPGSLDVINHWVPFFTPQPLGGAFTDPGKGRLGTAGRNIMVGPRSFTSDLSLMKNFKVTERLNAQFRMDAFNVFNHPVLGFNANQGNLCIDCSPTSNAGKITDIEADASPGSTTGMRQIEFALRFQF
jgi:carboxypeptidase family protein/TonB-dependent receptor-like protein